MKKALVVFALLTILISGCTLFQQPQQQPPSNQTQNQTQNQTPAQPNKTLMTAPALDYSILSYIKTDNVSTLVVGSFNRDAAKEISSNMGSMMGGNIIRKVNGAAIGVASYKDGSSAFVAYIKTNLTINDILDQLSSSTSNYETENKTIGGKEVTLIYSISPYSSDKGDPICTWRDGDNLNFLAVTRPISLNLNQCTFPAGMSCVSYNLSESGDLTLQIGQGTGHTIQVNGVYCSNRTDYSYTPPGVIYSGGKNVTIASGSMAYVAGGASGISVSCPVSGDTFTGRLYINYTEIDTGIVRTAVGSLYKTISVSAPPEVKMCDKLLENTYDYTGAVALFKESEFIRGKISFDGEFLGQAGLHEPDGYGVAFNDSDAVYIVYAAQNVTSPTASNSCYSYGGTSQIVKEGGKEACMSESSGGLTSSTAITLTRGIGDYQVGMYIIVEGSKTAAIAKAKDTIFSISLEGEEEHWSDTSPYSP